jgi:hypothetical protein
MRWLARFAKVGPTGLRAERRLRKLLRKAKLYPSPIHDAVISDILDELIYRSEASPKWGESEFSWSVYAPRYFNAPKRIDEAGGHIIMRFTPEGYQPPYLYVDTVLKEHFITPPGAAPSK